MFASVPSRSPGLVLGYNTSSTSIYVEWQLVPHKFIHGVPLGQKIVYTQVGDMSTLRQKKLNSTVVSVTLNNLRKYTNYCIQAVVFTRIGAGNVSECLFVHTDEDGRSKFKS